MSERRQHARMMLSGTFNAYEKESQKHLGRVANLSEGGFMLVSDEEVPTKTSYLLEIRYESHDGRSERLTVSAESIWCQQAGRENQYGAGFAFTRISPQASEALNRLLGR